MGEQAAAAPGLKRFLVASTALIVLAAAGFLNGTAVIGRAEAASGAGGNSGGGGTGGTAVSGTNGTPGNPGGADTVQNENNNGIIDNGTGGGGGSGGGAGGGTGGAGGGTYNDPNFGEGAGGTAGSPNGGAGAFPQTGNGTGITNTAGGGGGGGYGGANGNGAGAATLNNAGVLGGGNGGNGGDGGLSSNGNTNGSAYGGGGGGGGAGGYGAIITTGGSNTSTITGGNGGNGGAGGNATASGTGTARAGNGGSGGDGGVGLLITGAGGTFTNFGSGTIRGGNGGTGGTRGTATTGTGTATNGTAGAAGVGGVGISAAGVTIINAGTIAGGFANGGAGAQANAISFTGGTNRLELQAGYTITGNVVVQTGNGATGTLALGGTANATFDASQLGPTAQYQGFSAYEKTGTSTWTLTGTNALTAGWTINAGTLNVTGSLANAPFTVASGAILAGSGTLGSLTVNAGGFVQPGAVAGVPTTLTVANGLTFAAGATYRVTATPNAADRITVTAGTATLGGATVAVLAGSGTYAPSTAYTILSAPTVSGTFGTVTSNMAFLTPSLSYPNNTVVLTLTQAAPVTSVSTTPNQTSTGTAVQASVPTTPTTQPAATTTTTAQAPPQTTTQPAATQAATPAAQVATAVVTQTAQGAVQALNSLSGEVQASAISAQVQTAFLVQEAILDHLRFGEGNGFAGGFGLGGPGLTGAIGQRFAPGTTLPAMYSADLPGGAPVSLVPVRPVTPNYALWGQGFGAFGDTGGNGNAARLTRQTGGFVLGIETGFGALSNALVSDLRVGVAAGYTFTAFDVTARQSTGQVESGFGAVYGRGSLGAVQVRLGAAYAGNALDTRRTVLFPGFSQAVSGKAGGETVNGFGEVGYRVGDAQGYVEPFVGGAAVHIRRDGFAETGGASALTVSGRSFDVQTATAGVQGQAVVADLFGGAGPLVARGLVGYRRAFGDVVPQALLAFGGGGQAFLTSGVPVARDAVVASAGLDWQVGPRTTVGLSYNGQVGARAQDHAVKGSLSYRW